MAHHNKSLAEFTQRVAQRDFDRNNLKDRTFLVSMLVHCADVSNVCRPQPASLVWSQRVNTEFLNQGAQEKKRKLPVTFDAATFSGPKMALGFIKYIRPLFVVLCQLLPEVKVWEENLTANQSYWESQLPPPA
eukprot:TRINITY_DN5789_c0_g1_i1.p2 TRINITY_DN5789_c0_g1~~TRINITY_DN5789_c0_g1_i1.p2  ORF type:complete len:133 (-),score=35.04 TRINITY_DN5789_c0_g1_i1:22-420(-)